MTAMPRCMCGHLPTQHDIAVYSGGWIAGECGTVTHAGNSCPCRRYRELAPPPSRPAGGDIASGWRSL